MNGWVDITGSIDDLYKDLSKESLDKFYNKEFLDTMIDKPIVSDRRIIGYVNGYDLSKNEWYGTLVSNAEIKIDTNTEKSVGCELTFEKV